MSDHLTEQDRGYRLPYFDENDEHVGECYLEEDVEHDATLTCADFDEKLEKAEQKAETAYMDGYEAGLRAGHAGRRQSVDCGSP